MAVHSETAINDFHIRDVVRFPCSKTSKLLIEAGIDVQKRDNDGNTPLHLIVGKWNELIKSAAFSIKFLSEFLRDSAVVICFPAPWILEEF